MEINTLQEYMLTTEAHTYLVAIGSSIAFAFFWRALNKKPNRPDDKRPELNLESDNYRE